MSALLAAPTLFDEASEPAARHDSGTSGQTLDDLIVEAWEALSAGDAAVCPVCCAAMAPCGPGGGDPDLRRDAGAVGRCDSCRGSLS